MLAAMGPQATSEPFQQMLNNTDGNISLQEAAQATLAGVPSAAVMGAPTVNNTLAMARFNVVNVNTGVPDAELRRELHQHEVQLGEQARQEAEFEALRFRSLCEREPQSQLRSKSCSRISRSTSQARGPQQHVQSQDNVAIRRLQETLEEQRERFQGRLVDAGSTSS